MILYKINFSNLMKSFSIRPVQEHSDYNVNDKSTGQDMGKASIIERCKCERMKLMIEKNIA